MKCQVLFSLKNYKQKIRISSVTILLTTSKVYNLISLVVYFSRMQSESNFTDSRDASLRGINKIPQFIIFPILFL